VEKESVDWGKGKTTQSTSRKCSRKNQVIDRGKKEG